MHRDVIPLSLGIEGFRVMATDERDDVVEVAIETIVPAACCPGCGHGDGSRRNASRCGCATSRCASASRPG